MFDQPLGIADTDLDHLLRGLAEVRSQRRYDDVRELRLACDLADALPGPTEGEQAAHRAAGKAAWSLERTESLATGVPEVSEMAPSHLAFTTGTSIDAARTLLATALTLRHRLPRCWRLLDAESPEQVTRDLVPIWKLRLVAQLTWAATTAQAAEEIDRCLSWLLGRDPLASEHRICTAVRAARLRTEHAVVRAEEEEHRDRRGVWFRTDPKSPAATTVIGRLDTCDARALDATVDDLAATFAELGDDRSRDLRRAAGLASLADPQAVLDLQRGTTPPTGPAPATSRTAPVRQVVLNLHLTPADLSMGRCTDGEDTRQAFEASAGAVSARLVKTWLAGTTCEVRVRPVLTRFVPASMPVPGEPAVDGHDPTVAIRDAVLLGETTCVFPGCNVPSSACQLDHIERWIDPDIGGPPGQTRASNLAPLCQRHHRAKTHLGWAYERLPDGRYLWTSPTKITRIRHPRPVHQPAPASLPACEPRRAHLPPSAAYAPD